MAQMTKSERQREADVLRGMASKLQFMKAPKYAEAGLNGASDGARAAHDALWAAIRVLEG